MARNIRDKNERIGNILYISVSLYPRDMAIHGFSVNTNRDVQGKQQADILKQGNPIGCGEERVLMPAPA
jgi:hypothetical protein